jgi:serine protease inhibitor
MALGMTANGADGNTLKEFEALLGNKGISIKGLNIERDFLQTNADYYRAAAYKADFTSRKTVQDINDRVKANFSKMESSKEASIYVSDVLQNTFVSVDTQGQRLVRQRRA